MRDPVGQMQTVYDQLDLGDFEAVRPKLVTYFDEMRDYRVNRHQIDPELRDEIEQRWGRYMNRFGYFAEQMPSRAAG